jgi:hypothetical protein
VRQILNVGSLRDFERFIRVLGEVRGCVLCAVDRDFPIAAPEVARTRPAPRLPPHGPFFIRTD